MQTVAFWVPYVITLPCLDTVVFAAHHHLAVRPCRVSLMPIPLTPLNPQSDDAFLTTINQAPATVKSTTAISYHRRVVLVLEEFDRLDRHEELGTRGPTTPFLFSSLALYITSSGFRRLIEAFVRTCVAFPALDAEHKWREEARFTAPPELAMCLRRGLARVLRVYGGHAARGPHLLGHVRRLERCRNR